MCFCFQLKFPVVRSVRKHKKRHNNIVSNYKLKKEPAQIVTSLRNNKRLNSVLNLWLPLMWLPQPGDFK